MRESQRPTISKVSDPTHDSVERHPSYGQIGASRVSGRTYLYGSDFDHHHFVTIRISKSELNRGLSNDWAFSGEELIEVALSEAQWATFVSAMNVGGGVQCTIRHIQGEQMPAIESLVSRRKQFTREADDRLNDALEELEVLRGAIAAAKLSQKQKDEMLQHLGRAEVQMTSNLDFVANQFSEHIEKVTEHAKVEINAYLQQTIVRAGLDAMKAAPFTLPEGGDE